MTTLSRTIASVVMAFAVGIGLFVDAARADTDSQTMSVGLVRNDVGQACAIGVAVGSDFIFGKAAWNAATGAYEFANGGVKHVTLTVVNTMSNRVCRVDVRGEGLGAESGSISIYDLKLEESEASEVAIETVPRVPDQETTDVPAWLIREALDGQCVVVKATLSSRHIARAPIGVFTGLITLTGSASAP